MGRWVLSACLIFATASAASPWSVATSAANHAVGYTRGLATGISERIATRKLKASLTKATGVILFCASIIGCGSRAVVEQEPIIESTPQIQSHSVQPDDIKPDAPTLNQDDWPERMYVNNMGGILGADAEKFQATKTSLPAEFYERVFVLHQQNGLNYIHLVRPYSVVYPATDGLDEFDSTLVAISSSGQPLDYFLETSDIQEILVADHQVYEDSRSAIIPLSKAIPVGAKKLPSGHANLDLAGDTYMVMSGKHLLIRAFAAGDMKTNTFREIVRPMFVLSLKQDTYLMQLEKRNNKMDDKRHPYSIAQATE